MIRDLARPIRLRCLWCKQIGRHHDTCQEQLADWSRMTFGKHKGELIENVPEKYLEFCLRFTIGNKGARHGFLEELIRRDRERYTHPQWQEFAERDSNHA